MRLEKCLPNVIARGVLSAALAQAVSGKLAPAPFTEGTFPLPSLHSCATLFCAAASVAQLDRASDFGSEGCRFKSCRTRHFPLRIFPESDCGLTDHSLFL